MKKIIAYRGTALILMVVTLITLVFYTAMLLRPVSYGMEYKNVTEYGDEVFEGVMVFHADMTMVNRNTNLDAEQKMRYYYKDGYIFHVIAETDEDYAAEVATINEKFDLLSKDPLYAARANAFQIVKELDAEHVTVYTCQPAIVSAAVGGAVAVAFIALTTLAFVLRKRVSDKIKKL